MQLSLCVCPRQGMRLALANTLAYYAAEFITAVKIYDTGPKYNQIIRKCPK